MPFLHMEYIGLRGEPWCELWRGKISNATRFQPQLKGANLKGGQEARAGDNSHREGSSR